VLRAGELPVGELARQLGLSQPLVSKHLRVLRDAGLVQVRGEILRFAACAAAFEPLIGPQERPPPEYRQA
jgi:predicted ArsR family transcriptional regulator